MPVQLWNLSRTWDRKDSSFLQFDKCFAARFRKLFVPEGPRVPAALAKLLRPQQFSKDLNIVHNWGDVIFYPYSTIIRIYGLKGAPFILPYQVPLKIAIAKFLRQLGEIEDSNLAGKGRGTLFQNITISHQFIITKGGWSHMGRFLEPYHMTTTVVRTEDPEGFYNDMFKKRARCSAINHVFNFPEDIIKNVLGL